MVSGLGLIRIGLNRWRNDQMLMTIDDLKRALVEVRELCLHQAVCSPQCPLFITNYGGCPMKYMDFPEEWPVRDWKEDGKDV